MPSPTKEDYLKALFHLHQKDENISVTDLSKSLQVSKPTVNNMIKKLEKHKWVNYKKYKPIKLTKKGILQASFVIRKHRLSEMFLLQIMNFGWEEVHEIAEELEHLNSEKLFDRMDQLLGFPDVDPHGSPIPDKAGRINKQQLKKLSEVEKGKTVTLAALKNSSKDFLLFLNKKKLVLGTEISVTNIESFDNSYEIKYGKNKTATLSHPICQCLLVEVN